jgi:hypothetical protein
MNKRAILLLAGLFLAAFLAAGCRGERDRGINRGKDVPVPADTAAKEPR